MTRRSAPMTSARDLGLLDAQIRLLLQHLAHAHAVLLLVASARAETRRRDRGWYSAAGTGCPRRRRPRP